jgi:DNA-binding NtrC family response regulator/CHASE2 domain-containing sensor protein
VLPGAAVAVVATLLAAATWAAGNAGVVAMDWSIYDRWLRARDLPRSSSTLLVVERDRSSEARFGAGVWDRALLARVITSLTRAGAVAIGVDLTLGQPGASGRGGVAADALLSQATDLAGTVVYPIALDPGLVGKAAGEPAPLEHNPSWPPSSRLELPVVTARVAGAPMPGLVLRARGVGHTLSFPDADGVVRRVPLFARVGDSLIPAYGLALAAARLDLPPGSISVDGGVVVLGKEPARRIPIDSQGRVLVAFDSAGLPRGARVLPFQDLWTAIEGGRIDALRSLARDKLVLVLADPARGQRRTPLGVMSDVAIQAQLLATIADGDISGEVSRPWVWLGALVLAGLVAWLWLAWPWWIALGGTGVVAVGGVAALLVILSRAHLVLPLSPFLVASVVASVGALAWNHFASVVRLRQVESENLRVREALVRQESAVELLEEDLDAARTVVARSAGAERDLARAADALRVQLVAARTEEEKTRRRLGDLEHELRGLRASAQQPVALDDAEQERVRRECARMGIVTRDPAVLEVFRDLEKAARASLPILILGEPGTGKELFARAAHRKSSRAAGPFVAVNMAAVSPDLFESELFGHVRGSFTGAVGDRRGYFEQAEHGTIFLDEIGELRPDHQSKLLRVLQDRTFHRVGATRPTTVDVRVVAASNRDLERGIAEGWFREDLYFRIKGLVLRLPPLRERPDDVPLLAGRFVADAAAEAGRDDLALSEDAIEALGGYDWPGNVRELQHCLRQAVALGEGPLIGREDLRLPLSSKRASAGMIDADENSDAAVLACLRRHGFDMQATARALGWDRSTVTQRLKGLGFRALVESRGNRAEAALALAGDAALARAVELKLREYHEHLLRTVQAFDLPDAAIAASRRRFKNLPERYFRALEFLVRQYFEGRAPTSG